MPATPKGKITWNAQRIYKSIKRWIAVMADPIQQASDAIETVAKGTSQDVLIGRFGLLALWNGTMGVVGLMDGDAGALDHFYHAVYYSEAELRIMLTLSRINWKSGAHIPFNRSVLELARAVALGCWQEADQIADMLRTGLAAVRSARGQKYSAFYGTDITCVAPFILHLYAQWKGVPFPFLNTPVGRLYPVRSVPHNLFLDQALANSLSAVPQIIQPYL